MLIRLLPFFYDIFQDVNCACHHLWAEFRKQMIAPGVLHTFWCPDIAAQKLIADTGAVCLAETFHHKVVQPVCPQASFLVTGMSLTVHQAKNHQCTGTFTTGVSYRIVMHPGTAKKMRGLIFQASQVVVSVGLEPTTPSM